MGGTGLPDAMAKARPARKTTKRKAAHRPARKAASKSKRAKPKASRARTAAKRPSKAAKATPKRKPAAKRGAKRRIGAQTGPFLKGVAETVAAPAPTAKGAAGNTSRAGKARKALRIALFGASGMVGSRIVAEALARGHRVTAIQRDRSTVAVHPRVDVQVGSVTDAATVAQLVRGHDAVVSAVSPPQGDTSMLSDAARSLLGAARASGVKRLVVVGGAGSLEVAPGVMLVDTPAFPAPYKWIGIAHRDALAVYRAEGQGVDWTFVSPPAAIQPGARSGSYQVGADRLLKDKKGESRISAEDFAVAVLDEIEHGRYKGRRMTVASA